MKWVKSSWIARAEGLLGTVSDLDYEVMLLVADLGSEDPVQEDALSDAEDLRALTRGAESVALRLLKRMGGE